jgi:hypothetical protein
VPEWADVVKEDDTEAVKCQGAIILLALLGWLTWSSATWPPEGGEVMLNDCWGGPIWRG